MNRILPFGKSSSRIPAALAFTVIAATAAVAVIGGYRTGTSGQKSASNAHSTTTASPVVAVSDPAINARIQAQIQQSAAANRAAAVAHHGTGATAAH